MFKFYLYKLAQIIVNLLPENLAYQFAIFLSDIQYVCSFRDRKAVLNNLKAITPDDKNLQKNTREVFQNFGKYLVEFFRMKDSLNRSFISKRVRIKNLESLKSALESKKGAISLTAHIGNWELGGTILGQLGYSPVAIALPHKERPVNDLFNDQRVSLGMNVVSINVAFRKCLETLKNNGVIAIAADRDFSLNGVPMDFLGKKVMLPKGAAIFSCRTGAPIVPTFLMRDDDGDFTLSFEKPIFPPIESNGDAISEEILQSVMKKYITIIEEKIRRSPTQWLMFRQFWI